MQELRAHLDQVEGTIMDVTNAAARDLGLIVDKTLKLDWFRAANKAVRCWRITAKEEKLVRSKLNSIRCDVCH
jgi:DNA mismatch repair protein MSH2